MLLRDSLRSAVLGCGLIFSILLAGCGSQGASSALMGAGLKMGSGTIGASKSTAATLTIPTTHVLTTDYFADQFPAVTAAQMAPWLTSATAKAVDTAALKGAGIETMPYTNPNRQAPGGPMYTSDESTFAHDCSGNRITFPAHNGIYLMDPSSAKLAALWKQTILNMGGQFDMVYDDTPDNLAGATALPCNFDQTAWTAAENAMNATLGRSIIYNGLGNLGKSGSLWTISNAVGLNSSSVGGEMEGCYSNQDNTNPKTHGPVWQVLENTEIQMAQQRKQFVCRALNLTPASTAVDQRIYLVASFLLTYDLGTSVLSEKYPVPSGFDEEPESELVVTNPVIPTPSDISGLQISSNVFGREYGACYVAGVSVGPCGIAVNADRPGATHQFPWGSKYQNTMVLSGGGILDGGTIATNGPAPASTIPGDDAVIAFGVSNLANQPTLSFIPGTQTAPSGMFYALNGETGAISQEMDSTATGTLTNETLSYKGLFSGSFGWVSGSGQPGLTAWAAANYNITLNVTQPNAALQITDVRVYRVDANAGPASLGLALVGELAGLSQPLASNGKITFTVAGPTQAASLTDRLVVRFKVLNTSSKLQSFSYDAGTGALSNLTVVPL